MTIFDERTLTECTDSLARYHPDGKLFEAKNIDGTNYRSFLQGLSFELCRAQDLLITYINEVLPDTTTLLIAEWQSALGIPDDCISGGGATIEQRRDILLKLAASGLQTAQDFIDFAKIFGFVNPEPGEITVSQGVSKFEIIITFPTGIGSDFPYTFPILFGTEATGVLQCLFTTLKPANCSITFTF